MPGSKRTPSVLHEAVIFFDRGRVVKEMLYMEFAAVLDHVVDLPEFADRELHAVYLRINDRHRITGCVFFRIDFDASGRADPRWNVPLAHLLDKAGRGPDLGAGRIRLACRSQCPISWHQNQLWDPELDGESNSFVLLMRAVRRNRLGLPTPDDELEEATMPPAVEPGVAQSPLHLATLKSACREQIEQLHRQYQARLTQTAETLTRCQEMLQAEQEQRQQLQQQLDRQTHQLQQWRERWQQTQGNKEAQRDQVLQREFELELQARTQRATSTLQEQLDKRQIELLYRDEQLAGLQEEVTRLRQEREALLQHSGNRVLQRLAEAGVTFVAYQPGADHMTIPLADLGRYLDSPLDYTAHQCHVTARQYQQWLSHYELPTCIAVDEEGDRCDEPLARITRPNEFMPGGSDRCLRHRTTSLFEEDT